MGVLSGAVIKWFADMSLLIFDQEGAVNCRVRTVFLLTILMAFVGSVARAQGGVDRLDEETAARIDKVFERYARPDCPGCAIGVARDGKVVYTHGYGMANLEYSVRITPATIFEAGSVSKQFTTGAILILARQGKLSLDDDIRKYLPEVPDFGHKIAIRNLLSHTSGLRDQWELLTIMGRPPGSAVHTLDEILDLVSRQRELNFLPGDEFLYSNTGFSLLAWIVRRASGMSLAEFSAKELFQPLGMKSTQWRDDYTRIVKGRATAYNAGPGGEYHTNMSFTNVYGNGGLLTTVGDLLIWNENFVEPRVIGREYLDQMQTRGSLNDGSPIPYGFGLEIMNYGGIREISHDGSTAGYDAYLARFPDERLSIALLCNLANINTGVLVHQIAGIFLEGRLKGRQKPQRVDVPASEIQRLAGLYRNELTDGVLPLFASDGRLFAGAGMRDVLTPIGKDRFEGPTGMRFVFTLGQPVRLDIHWQDEHPMVYTAVPVAIPSLQQLAEYAGTYYSAEVEVTLVLTLREGKLILRRRLAPDTPMTPTYADAFSGGGRTILFTRDRSGTVNGLTLSSGRVLHLRFLRRPN